MKILIVSPRPARPARRGHQLRALRVASELAAAGHEVTLLTPAGRATPDPAARLPFREVAVPVPPARAGVGVASALLSGLPAQAGLVEGAAFVAAFDRLAHTADLVVFQLARLVRLSERLVRRGGPPWVADLVDSLALNVERRAERDRPWLRPLLRVEARRLLAIERRMVTAAASAWLVAERDRAWLAQRLGAVAGRLELVPIGLEVPELPPVPPRGPRPMACLTGNLGYFPTREGARWLLAEVWPRLAERSAVDLVVAGSRPGRSLARAVRRAGGRLVADPESLGATLARATVALVPLVAGSGVPIKMLEAWAAGVPVVATPWAAAGAAGVAGFDHLGAESPAEWAQAIAALASDRELGARLAAGGRDRLVAVHSAERLREALARSIAAL